MVSRLGTMLCLSVATLQGGALEAGSICDTVVAEGQFGRIEICASSVLDPQAGNTYGPGNMSDGDPATAWVEGVEGVGIGQWVEMRFDYEMTFQTIELIAGYSKSERLHALNAAPSRVAVLADGWHVQDLWLADSMELQVLRLQTPVSATALRLVVQDALPGARWKDLAISEFHIDLEELNYSSF